MKIPPELAVFLHFGWTAALTMALFCLGGNYLDKKLNTFPVALLSLGAVGVAITTVLFVLSVQKATKKMPKRSQAGDSKNRHPKKNK